MLKIKNYNNIYAHKDYNKIKSLCHKVKNNNDLDIAAFIMSKLIPKDCTIIPMPSHFGEADWSLSLAYKVLLFRNDISVFNCLYEIPNDSSYELKKKHIKPNPKIVLKYGYIPPVNSVLIDNVYDTGATYHAACKALGKEIPIVVLGKTCKN